jgi:sulfatase modifying factor 1
MYRTDRLRLSRLVIFSFGIVEIGFANSAPVVSNVTANQRHDGSKIIDIRFDLADADGDACNVSMLVSNDNGQTWDVSVSSLSGAVGPGILQGTNKLIVWDSSTDIPTAYGTNYKVRVIADDGVHVTPPGMIPVSAGTFAMGDPWNEGDFSEQPTHQVTLSAYFIDAHETTTQQFVQALNWARNQGGLIWVENGVVYEAGSGTSFPYCETTTSRAGSRVTWNGSTFGVLPGHETHPIVYVTWYGAAAYCNWRSAMQGLQTCFNFSTWNCDFAKNGFRLPTEAEWEKAAGWDPTQVRHYRFGEQTDGCGSDCLDGQRANYWASGDPFDDGNGPWTTPIGYYDGTTHGQYSTQNAQSFYGCYDMTGNAVEWCYDWYSETYYSDSPTSNPLGPLSSDYRVFRGGSCGGSPYYARSAHRWRLPPDHVDDALGLRCVIGIH